MILRRRIPGLRSIIPTPRLGLPVGVSDAYRVSPESSFAASLIIPTPRLVLGLPDLFSLGDRVGLPVGVSCQLAESSCHREGKFLRSACAPPCWSWRGEETDGTNRSVPCCALPGTALCRTTYSARSCEDPVKWYSVPCFFSYH